MLLKSIGIGLALGSVLLLGRIDAAGAVGVGGICGGGIHGGSCDPGLFCDHKAGECHLLGARGKCVPIPILCPLTQDNVSFKVCGCNGTTYWNDCERIRAMVQKNHNGPCK